MNDRRYTAGAAIADFYVAATVAGAAEALYGIAACHAKASAPDLEAKYAKQQNNPQCNF